MDGRYDNVIVLLRGRGANDIPHPGGTLLAHLHRVEERLHVHGADDVLRLAALAHAVYSTDGFATHLLTLDERDVLRKVAGDEVEQLVYLYAACDRKRSWANLGDSHEVYDRWSGTPAHLDSRTLSRFVDLSTVNELDVAENAAAMEAKHAESLLQIFRSWGGLGSKSVTADAYRVLTPTPAR